LPCLSWITDASTALDVTAVLIAIGTVLTASELITLRREFRRFGDFDPQVLISTRPGALTGPLALVSMPRVAGVQLVLAVTVILCLAFDISPAVPFVALAAMTMLRPYLLPYGSDGSDTMARVLTITVAIAFSFAHSKTVVQIALAFIAAQLCLAYGASGVAKLFGGTWRSGSAVQRILHTGYGHAGLVRSTVDRWPSAGKVVTWLVVGLEILFPLGVVLGSWFALAVLVGVATLQVAIAFAMGLNRFTPWFLAAFPAAAWTACQYGVLSR
jgi:hypothetical protein